MTLIQNAITFFASGRSCAYARRSSDPAERSPDGASAAATRFPRRLPPGSDPGRNPARSLASGRPAGGPHPLRSRPSRNADASLTASTTHVKRRQEKQIDQNRFSTDGKSQEIALTLTLVSYFH